VGFITLFTKKPALQLNEIPSLKSFILLFSRLTSVIKYNDFMVKYPPSDETIWLTMSVSFRFIRLENG
jgi:hypothetical protein